MTTEVKVPALPESVSDGVVVAWHKQPGESIRRDEALVDIETDKVVLEVPAPVDGVLEKILIANGDTVIADQVIGLISPGQSADSVQASARTAAETQKPAGQGRAGKALGPAARKLVADHQIDPEQITGTGKNGHITKADVLAYIGSRKPALVAVREAPKPARQPAQPVQPTPGLPEIHEDRPQKRVPMSRLRARVAERLLQATQSTAMLTTFNEVNMQSIMSLREKHRETFEQHHGVRLGYMSFFVRSAAEALKRHPDINASIDGDDIVYHGFCDIGVAISTDRGLVVPVLRNAEYMSLAEIETDILEFVNRARDGKLTMEDITGGTFSITNGGVFGSMLSTPILNPPQSAILGMHKIQERAMVVEGEIVVQPIMYLALTYDHRIVDGKSAVTFLVTIKELLEDPAGMLL
ncbi:MAG: 2-oxoglutarate dehydrogenase complex dihydrolipoyllysine-residue succinyltransferase, partial [Gammaproteobacteria bacterium]|nr:2-oxoglutarate dehydrogenase complex dihydrolipoyllysine-residue succinyltransferase [Gammaproteobacteria bacterium]